MIRIKGFKNNIILLIGVIGIIIAVISGLSYESFSGMSSDGWAIGYAFQDWPFALFCLSLCLLIYGLLRARV